MSEITFTPAKDHMETHPDHPEYVYLNICTDDGGLSDVHGYVRPEVAKLITAAPVLLAVLDDLEDTFDREIEPEQRREDYDAPDDREYTVTITAKQWRALGRALNRAHNG